MSLWQTRRYTVFCLLTSSYLKHRHRLKRSEEINTHTNTNSTVAKQDTFSSSSQIHCRTAAGKQARINPMYHRRCLRRREKHVIASNQMLSLLPLHSPHDKIGVGGKVATSQTKLVTVDVIVTTLSPNLPRSLLSLENLRRGGTAYGSCGSSPEVTTACSSWLVAVLGSVGGLASQFVSALSPADAETETFPSSILISGHGARSYVDTVSSRPLGCLMYAYQGFASSSKTSTQSESLLLRTWRRTNTEPLLKSQVGIALPNSLFAEIKTFVRVESHCCGAEKCSHRMQCFTENVIPPLLRPCTAMQQ